MKRLARGPRGAGPSGALRDGRLALQVLRLDSPSSRPLASELPKVAVEVPELGGHATDPDPGNPFEGSDLAVQLLVRAPEAAHAADSESIWAFWSLSEKSTNTVLTSVNSSIAAEPASRPPLPVFLTPPNGRCTSAPMVGALM